MCQSIFIYLFQMTMTQEAVNVEAGLTNHVAKSLYFNGPAPLVKGTEVSCLPHNIVFSHVYLSCQLLLKGFQVLVIPREGFGPGRA